MSENTFDNVLNEVPIPDVSSLNTSPNTSYNSSPIVTGENLDIDPIGMSSYTSYNKFRLKSSNSDYAQTPVFYMFMTAPSLNMDGNNLSNSKFLQQMYTDLKGKKLLDMLSYGIEGKESIMKMLTNRAGGFSLNDTSSQTRIIGETWTKLKQVYLAEDNDSRSAGTLTIEYSEKPGIPVTKLHKAWYEYAQGVRRGMFSPHETVLKQRAVDYQASIYFFLCAPDGETIEFFSKYTGVMPTAVPYSSFSGKKANGDRIKLNIPYSYSYKEDLEPEILLDFNIVNGHGEGYFDGMAKDISDTAASILRLLPFTNKFNPSDPLEGLDIIASGSGLENVKAGASGVYIAKKEVKSGSSSYFVPIIKFDDDINSPSGLNSI